MRAERCYLGYMILGNTIQRFRVMSRVSLTYSLRKGIIPKLNTF